MQQWEGTNGLFKKRCITEYVYIHIFYQSLNVLGFPDKIF